MMLLIVHNYFFRVPDISRIFYPIGFFWAVTFLVLFRGGLQRLILRYLIRNRLPQARVLIVGLNPVSFRIAARILRRPEYALDLVGFLTTKDEKVGKKIANRPVFGKLNELRKVIRENNIQDVFITLSEMDHQQLFKTFVDGEIETARVHVVPSLTEMMRTTIHYDENLGVPVYQVRDTPLRGIRLVAKRVMDISFSGIGLTILSPLLAFIALRVKMSSPGPVFYKQERVGTDGQRFMMYKFRTMKIDAEAKGPVWGERNDNRATKFGAFLRRTNLDELPQLWNVFRGDMSLVGPRPERAIFADQLKEVIPHYMSRHHVKTGMTGWAQVHGLRGKTSITQRLRYDLYYIENWSLWLDVKILLMTIYHPRRPRVKAVRADMDQYLRESKNNHDSKDSQAFVTEK